MAYGTCTRCGASHRDLNHNNLCPDCANYPGVSNPAPHYGVCRKCGKSKMDINGNGICGSCNSGTMGGLW